MNMNAGLAFVRFQFATMIMFADVCHIQRCIVMTASSLSSLCSHKGCPYQNGPQRQILRNSTCHLANSIAHRDNTDEIPWLN